MKVILNDVIEAIEFEGELIRHFYNKKTGIIMYLEDENTSNYKADDINNLENFEEWEQELIIGLYDLKKNFEDYIQLPTIEEINEHKTMIEFCRFLNFEEFKNKDLKDLQKEYSMRKIREYIENNEKLDLWYEYRENFERELAINWCEKNYIEYM